jgi:phosphoribosylaminoimidazole-succinocarboxamide synthase
MGKTKDIISNSDLNKGLCMLRFKDDACGEDGVFDPGANQVGLKIDGMGRASLLLSKHFFQILGAEGIRTHYLDADIEQGTMTCHRGTMLPVEFIWREKAWGSFCKMYGVAQGYPLNGLVEATLKDDVLGDPRVNREACILLQKLTPEQYDQCDKYIRDIGIILRRELAKYDYELVDFKVEFGINAQGEIMLADEISGGIWRLLDKDGKPVDPVACAKKICNEYYAKA